MKLYLKDEFDFIPDYGNNKKLNKNEQIVFHLKHVNRDEIMDLPKYAEEPKAYLRAYWNLVCTGIDNLYNNDKELTPNDFYDTRTLKELRNEVEEYYIKITGTDKKK